MMLLKELLEKLRGCEGCLLFFCCLFVLLFVSRKRDHTGREYCLADALATELWRRAHASPFLGTWKSTATATTTAKFRWGFAAKSLFLSCFVYVS